jgi:hypothetical protein
MSQIYNAFVKAGFSPSKPLEDMQAPRVFRVPRGTVVDQSKPILARSGEVYIRDYFLGFKTSTYRATEYARTFGVRSRINTKSSVPLSDW